VLFAQEKSEDQSWPGRMSQSSIDAPPQTFDISVSEQPLKPRVVSGDQRSNISVAGTRKKGDQQLIALFHEDVCFSSLHVEY
jgi:hypothetical protein